MLRAGEKGLSQREKLKYLTTLQRELPRLKTEATGVSQSPGAAAPRASLSGPRGDGPRRKGLPRPPAPAALNSE